MLNPVRPSAASAVPDRPSLNLPHLGGGRRRVLNRAAGALTASLAFLCFFLPIWHASFPPLPQRIALEVNFPRGITGRCEPIITTGRTGDGDFLAVRYIDGATAVFVYDVWGVGGPTSQPFALQPGQRRRVEIEMPT